VHRGQRRQRVGGQIADRALRRCRLFHRCTPARSGADQSAGIGLAAGSELQHPHAVAIGETGLDYHYEPEAAELQQQSFRLHLEAARLTGKPVIVHTREARADTLALLREASLPQAGVLHCFTEDWEMARAALDLGFYISLSGIVTFRNADALREVARQVPADRLLVETDSPYLAPIPHRGKANLPQYVREVAEFLAQLRGVSFEQLAEQTTANFRSLFPLARVRG